MEQGTVKNYNIAIMSIAFMMVFTGFNTMSGIQTLIFKSATTPDSGGYIEGFSGNGFICSAVIYAVFSVASWFSPSVVAFKGNKMKYSKALILLLKISMLFIECSRELCASQTDGQTLALLSEPETERSLITR